MTKTTDRTIEDKYEKPAATVTTLMSRLKSGQRGQPPLPAADDDLPPDDDPGPRAA